MTNGEARDALAAKLATFLRAKYPEHYYRDLERATDDHETIGLSLQDAAAILELACGVGLAAPPASDEPERARIIREIAGRAAFYHGQPGADVDFLLGEVRRVRLARPDGGTETP